MSEAHSYIGPSTSSYWAPPGACTGFVKMARNYPEEETLTGRSVEGTVAHGVSEIWIQTLLDGGTFDPTKLINTLDPATGTLITAEMVEACEVFVSEFFSVYGRTLDGMVLTGIEKRLTMRGIHEDMFGTCDAYIVDFHTKTIYVWDFKYGFSVVHAFENYQLIAYLYGIGSELARQNISTGPDWKVSLRIVQPRAYVPGGPIRKWDTTIGELQPYFEQLKKAALEVTGSQGVCRTGTRCRYCPARHACPALAENASSAAQYAGSPTPELLYGQALSVELSILTQAKEALEYRLSGLTSQAEQSILGGERIPGWEMKRTKGKERWKDPAQAKSIASMLGIDITKEAYITPNQARKAGFDESIVAGLSERAAGKSKLEPITKQKLNRIFNQ